MNRVPTLSGRRAVLAIAVSSSLLVAALGYVVGGLGTLPSTGRVGPVLIPLTPLGLAGYGLLTVGSGLTLVVALVAFVVRTREN